MDEYEYDAFVVYNPYGEDESFVRLMTKVLGASPYNLKLYVPWGDNNDESFEAVLTAENIEKRCKKVIVVLSSESLQSDLFQFQLKIAHSMSPAARSKKIIPIRLDQTEVPASIRFATTCDYFKEDLRVWIWDRVYAAFMDKPYTYKLALTKTMSLPEKNKLPDLVPASPLTRVRTWWRTRTFVA